MIPDLIYVVDMPEILVKSKRKSNRFTRIALDEQLVDLFRRRLPGHFKTSARGKYNYAPRSSAYKRQKLRRFGSRTDLVKTGDTKREATSGYKISGTRRHGAITRVMRVRISLKGRAMKVRQIKSEINRTIPSEERQMGEGMRDSYTRQVYEDARKKRKRVRIGPR